MQHPSFIAWHSTIGCPGLPEFIRPKKTADIFASAYFRLVRSGATLATAACVGLSPSEALVKETDGSENEENEPDALYLWSRQNA